MNRNIGLLLFHEHEPHLQVVAEIFVALFDFPMPYEHALLAHELGLLLKLACIEELLQLVFSQHDPEQGLAVLPNLSVLVKPF